ncbi:MAG: penicillin acylase [Blastocatellia bacterium]
MKKYWFIGWTLALWLTLAPVSHACSIFSIKLGDKVLVGNNEDFWYDRDARLWFAPAAKNNRGRVLFGWDNFAQGGMNDAGLFFDAASGPRPPAAQPGKSQKIKTNIGDELLARCATVEEAVALMQTYRLPTDYTGHLLFADKSGASAVVEWNGAEYKVIRKIGDYQIITNFLLTQPELGDFPCPRYNRLQERLTGKQEITGSEVATMLASVAQFSEAKGRKSGTLYSTVHDLVSGEFVLFYQRNWQKPVRFKLAEELRKGKHSIRMAQLFGKHI